MVERSYPGTEEFRKHEAILLQRYEFASGFTKGKSVLDVACGCGYGSAMMAENGAKKVLGIDISKDAIDFAQRYRNQKVDFMVMDAAELEGINEKFDVIVSIETIEHLKDYRPFLKHMKNLMHKDSTLILTTPNKAMSSGTNPYHIKEFYLDEFRGILEKIFHKAEFYGQRRTSRGFLKRVANKFAPTGKEFFYGKNDFAILKRGIGSSLHFIVVCSNQG